MKIYTKHRLWVCAALVLAVLITASGCTMIRRNSWMEKDGQYYYYDDEKQMVTGWLILEDGTYYLDENGWRYSGWLECSGKYHYFAEDGRMTENGWVGENGNQRLLIDGAAATGLVLHEGKYYYFAEDGRRITGWLDLEDGRRYFDPTEGWSLSGVQTIDDVIYGFTTEGLLTSGWLEVDGITYRIADDGTALPGGWHEIEDERYYLGEDGRLYTGWLDEDNHTYYMKEGQHITGILELEGRNYYFDSRGWHTAMVNPWNPVPDDYEVNVTSIGGDHSIATSAAAAFASMNYVMQQQEFGPIITSSYRSSTRQQEIFDERMAGYMAQGMSREDAYAKTVTSVAIPGTSEHQLGLAVDLTDAFYDKLDEGQMETPTQLWLIENSWRYGFILRYPAGKSEITGIIYEPWHYRYVGKELAAELYELNLTMEEYFDMLTEDKSLTASNPKNGNTAS